MTFIYFFFQIKFNIILYSMFLFERKNIGEINWFLSHFPDTVTCNSLNFLISLSIISASLLLKTCLDYCSCLSGESCINYMWQFCTISKFTGLFVSFFHLKQNISIDQPQTVHSLANLKFHDLPSVLRFFWTCW